MATTGSVQGVSGLSDVQVCFFRFLQDVSGLKMHKTCLVQGVSGPLMFKTCLCTCLGSKDPQLALPGACQARLSDLLTFSGRVKDLLEFRMSKNQSRACFLLLFIKRKISVNIKYNLSIH